MEHLLRQDHKIIPDYVRVYESATGGWVDLHPWHGAQELEDNLATAKILADKGHCLQLLPTLHAHETVLRQHLLPDVFEKKNPDVRIVRVSQKRYWRHKNAKQKRCNQNNYKRWNLPCRTTKGKCCNYQLTSGKLKVNACSRSHRSQRKTAQRKIKFSKYFFSTLYIFFQINYNYNVNQYMTMN